MHTHAYGHTHTHTLLNKWDKLRWGTEEIASYLDEDLLNNWIFKNIWNGCNGLFQLLKKLPNTKFDKCKISDKFLIWVGDNFILGFLKKR